MKYVIKDFLGWYFDNLEDIYSTHPSIQSALVFDSKESAINFAKLIRSSNYSGRLYIYSFETEEIK